METETVLASLHRSTPPATPMTGIIRESSSGSNCNSFSSSSSINSTENSSSINRMSVAFLVQDALEQCPSSSSYFSWNPQHSHHQEKRPHDDIITATTTPSSKQLPIATPVPRCPPRKQKSVEYQSKLHYHRPASITKPESLKITKATMGCRSPSIESSSSHELEPNINPVPVMPVQQTLKDDDPFKFICLECGKMFTKKAYLKSHWVCHSKEYPHVCRKRQSVREKRLNHERLTEQDEEAEVEQAGEQCGKRFRRHQDLMRHERTVRH
ncbi:hypothetical protein BDR26DRAFT_864890 [Obelidium mucronatum]|nr:hypothetical protein BDR26DRAFT_864890 [Obelidium mucronatum]